MEQNKKPGILTYIILIAGALFGAIFLNKKLKEHNLRIPTLGEFLVFAFVFSIAAWIVIIIGAIVIKIVTFFYHLF